jgi:hypothetical protein
VSFASWWASNFYASGFEMLYRAHLALGNAERGKEVLLWGLREMPRSSRLRALAQDAGLEGVAAPVATEAGVEEARTCVRTRLLTEVDDPVAGVVGKLLGRKGWFSSGGSAVGADRRRAREPASLRLLCDHGS